MPQLFSTARLRRSASFQHLTSVSVATFDKMLKQLRDPWEATQRRKPKSGRLWEVGGLEDRLPIMLLYYRCYVTQEFLDFFCQVNRSVTCRAIQRIEAHVKSAFAEPPRVQRCSTGRSNT